MQNFFKKLKENPLLLKAILLGLFVAFLFLIIDQFFLTKKKQSVSYSDLKTKEKNIQDLRKNENTNEQNLTIVTENDAKLKDLQKESKLKSDLTKSTLLLPTEKETKEITFEEKQKEEKEKLKNEILKDKLDLNVTLPKQPPKTKKVELAIEKEKPITDDIVIPKQTNNKKTNISTNTIQTDTNNRKILVSALFKENNKQSIDYVQYIEPKEQILDVNDSNISVANNELYILPGSSFYGVLTNPLYSLHQNMKAIVKIEHKEFIGCNFIGEVKIFQTNAALMITLKDYYCKNGKSGSVNGIAVKLEDFKPIFADDINRHLLPKALLVTVDALLNGANAAFEAKAQQTTTTDLTTMTSVKESKNNFGNVADYFKPNKEITDEILKELLSNYKTEITVNPQAMIVIFY